MPRVDLGIDGAYEIFLSSLLFVLVGCAMCAYEAHAEGKCAEEKKKDY